MPENRCELVQDIIFVPVRSNPRLTENFSERYINHMMKGQGIKRKEKNRRNNDLARHQLSIFNYWSRFMTISLTTDYHYRRF